MTTVREIAELAGVSKSTVSLVLNNKPGVSDEMRRIVLEAQSHLKQQKQLASSHEIAPSSGQTHADDTGSRALSIVVLHPPVMRSSYVFREVLRGIQTAAETYNIQLRLVANDPFATVQHVSYLYFSDPYLRPDGVLVFGAQQHEPLLEQAFKQDIPCVVLGRQANKYDVSGLGRNEARYAYGATHYLLDLGHRAIAFLGGEQVYDYLHNRINGYRHALKDAEIEVDTSWVRLGNGVDATRSILEQSPEITAVIYVNDRCAEEGLPIIEQAGLKIPADISVISFDDTEFAQRYSPPLTSVSYRRFEEGQWAVRMLVDQIRYPYIESVQTVFKADLIKRGSCAAPRL
jgi:DNA-binding LacI/PurR family transcriptional regulator